jgi:hypothetical protein
LTNIEKFEQNLKTAQEHPDELAGVMKSSIMSIAGAQA